MQESHGVDKKFRSVSVFSRLSWFEKSELLVGNLIARAWSDVKWLIVSARNLAGVAIIFAIFAILGVLAFVCFAPFFIVNRLYKSFKHIFISGERIVRNIFMLLGLAAGVVIVAFMPPALLMYVLIAACCVVPLAFSFIVPRFLAYYQAFTQSITEYYNFFSFVSALFAVALCIAGIVAACYFMPVILASAVGVIAIKIFIAANLAATLSFAAKYCAKFINKSMYGTTNPEKSKLSKSIQQYVPEDARKKEEADSEKNDLQRILNFMRTAKQRNVPITPFNLGSLLPRTACYRSRQRYNQMIEAIRNGRFTKLTICQQEFICVQNGSPQYTPSVRDIMELNTINTKRDQYIIKVVSKVPTPLGDKYNDYLSRIRHIQPKGQQYEATVYFVVDGTVLRQTFDKLEDAEKEFLYPNSATKCSFICK